MEVWLKVRNSEHSSPFVHAVDADTQPEYYKIIKEPMTLEMIKEKIESNQYRSEDDYKKDMELMKENCYLYNSNRYTDLLYDVDKLMEIMEAEFSSKPPKSETPKSTRRKRSTRTKSSSSEKKRKLE
jgi:hypothetical protein